jgi:SNF family Na+-dependent transporter
MTMATKAFPKRPRWRYPPETSSIHPPVEASALIYFWQSFLKEKLKMFPGVGYVKVLCSFFLATYYPVIMAISLFYALWSMKGPLPFAECNSPPVTIVQVSPNHNFRL